MYTYFLVSIFLLTQVPSAYATPAHDSDRAKAQISSPDGVKQIDRVPAGKQKGKGEHLSPLLPPEAEEAAIGMLESLTIRELPDLSLVRTVACKRHPIGAVLKTPIPLLYQVNIGSEIYYLSQNGRYLLQGDLIDLKTRKNLTEAHRDAVRLAAIKSIPVSDLIVYPAFGESRYAVTVFSDVDCPYCQLLHEHLNEYRGRGIDVRFAAFPRNGIDSLNYRRAVSVWCADDRNTALDRASQGLSIPERDCQAPVEKEYLIGVQIGISTTPSFILGDGTLISGFVAPDNLVRILEGERDTTE